MTQNIVICFVLVFFEKKKSGRKELLLVTMKVFMADKDKEFFYE